jgi:hypothetical protein
MSAGEQNGTIRLHKIKRPGGLYWFDLQPLAEDRDGTWLSGPIGTPWHAPRDSGTLAVPVVVLLATGRPWVTWWVGDPADRRLEIDVSRAPEITETGWQYVDLELDPIRHESDGRVEIEDWDEYEEACRNDWMSADDAKLALVVAEGCAHALRAGAEPWLQRGWHLLDRL